MTERFQYARADGDPNYTGGDPQFGPMWEHAFDHLRFHKGKRFEVERRPDGQTHTMPLREVAAFLKPKLVTQPFDTKFIVKSITDGYALAFRRHEFTDPEAVQMIQIERELIGTPYVFGFHDCSWLTMHAVELVEPSIQLAHKATLQMQDPRVIHIPRERVKMGDLLFHWGDASGVDHVSTFLDSDGPGGNGRVIDTEPHDTGAPAGWPTGMLGTGVRVRPMNPGYYCDWAHVVAIGRIQAINGSP